MKNPEHEAKTVGFGTIFFISRGSIKDIFNEGMSYICGINMFHLGDVNVEWET